MKILCLSDDKGTLAELVALSREAMPDAKITEAGDSETALYGVSRTAYDAVIMEAEWNSLDGMRLARDIHDLSPTSKIVFVTPEKKYALPAYKTRASGYLVMPVLPAELRDELADIGLAVFKDRHKVNAVTFGNFDLLCDGVSVKFKRSKSKELIAYLIDRRGTPATSSELIVNLWEDKDVDRTTRSMLHSLISDIKKTLSDYEISDILETQHNSFKINESRIDCDYYAFLNGKNSAKRKFTGEYMSSYPWAEMTVGVLSELSGIY